jgi:hypothetical protein
MNLNEGKVWAATFELTAGTHGTLYLNSDPNANQNYFYIGNSTNYLQFTAGGSLIIDA